MHAARQVRERVMDMVEARRSNSMLNRRALLGALATAAGAGILPHVVRAQAAPHRFTIGSIELTVLSDGTMQLPLSFVLPRQGRSDIDALLQGRGLIGDALAAQVNVVVLKTADRLVLVDTGGTKDFMPSLGQLSDRFESAGFKAESVTDIVLTHAHPDHLWGAVDDLDESRFAKARIHLSAVEHDFWRAGGRAEGLPDTLQGMAGGTKRRLALLEPQIARAQIGREILPGISLLDTAGHTPGHVAVLVNSDGQSLVIGGDALSNPLVSFERPDWAWGPDLEPERAAQTRRSLLDRLATDRTPLLGYHLPWPGLGRVERKDLAYRFLAG